MRNLVMITLTGLAVSGVGIDAAAAMDNRPACVPVAGATATSRELEWDGSNILGLSVGGDATYIRGSDDKVHASGDTQLLAHLQVHDAEIRLDCNGGHFDTSNLVISLPGREFKAFAVLGSGALSLRKLDQQTLKVTIAGSGSVKAQGRVVDADLDIAGSGNADMGEVAAATAKVQIAGSGNADIAPHEEADIHIVGSGNVNLHTSPARMETHIMGSGRVRNIATAGNE
jgi:hypothetical protein